MLPHFEPKEIPFGGSTSSEDFNEMNKEIALEISKIFRELTDNDVTINNVLNTISIENAYLNDRINEIQQQIESLESTIGSNSDGLMSSGQATIGSSQATIGSSQATFTTFGYEDILESIIGSNEVKKLLTFQSDGLISFGEGLIGYEDIDENDRININYNYDAVTLPILKQDSKTFLNNMDDKVFIPDDLDVMVESPDYPNAEISENNTEYALYQDITTQWIREYKYENPENAPDYVEATMTIDVPNSIMTDMRANTIYINPFPSGSLTIESVEYKSINDGDFKPLDKRLKYYDVNSNFRPIHDAKSTLLAFPDKQIKTLRIKFKQSKIIEDEVKYVIGAQNISIFYTDYNATGKVLANFNIPQTDGSYIEIEQITNVVPIFSNMSQDYANVCNVVKDIRILAEEEETGALREVNQREILPSKYNENFWIEVELEEVAEVSTPVLKSLEVEYINA
jgi:hypothetical protein